MGSGGLGGRVAAYCRTGRRGYIKREEGERIGKDKSGEKEGLAARGGWLWKGK